jgi:uncharacterized membrane protein
MAEQLGVSVRLVTFLGCGLMSGVFFIFSNTIVRSLTSLEPSEGIKAMQAINRVIVNPLFLVVFLGTTLLSAVIIVTSFRSLPDLKAVYFILGGLLYIIGAFVVTALFNIPLNNRLAALNPDTLDSASQWANYVSTWMNWNHVRTFSSLAATLLFMLGLRL